MAVSELADRHLSSQETSRPLWNEKATGSLRNSSPISFVLFCQAANEKKLFSICKPLFHMISLCGSVYTRKLEGNSFRMTERPQTVYNKSPAAYTGHM